MGKRLNTWVFVDGSWHGPGNVPDEIADLIDNPKVWEVDPESQEVPVRQLDDGDLIPETPVKVEVEQVLERPRGNASRDKWADYAKVRDIDVEDDMNRDDIIAAVDLADEE
jgi:hypothetical protein